MAAGDEAWTVTLTTLKANWNSRALRVASGDQAVDQCNADAGYDGTLSLIQRDAGRNRLRGNTR